MKFKHYTVMKKQAVDSLNCQKGKIYIDATFGGGGHSEEILKRISPDGVLVAFDVDQDAISYGSERLKKYKNIKIVKDSYINIKKNLQELGIKKITGGILFDLGASYHQLTDASRGFSFNSNAHLDMRFDKSQKFSAYDVVNSYSENSLIEIFSRYGEERFSKRIAKAICNKRPLNTTKELADLIIKSTPYTKSRIHPATRVFQAIRIEVNNELKNIKNTIDEVVPLLSDDAIISLISFHSLEDRLVKQAFKHYAKSCHCEKNDLVCKCEKAKLEILTKKPVCASKEEIIINPPSRSAKLRTAKKINSTGEEVD